MSEFIGNIGDTVELVMTLESANWIGKSRPIIANMFSAQGNIVSILSTRQVIQAITIGEQVRITGKVKAHRIINGEKVTQLEKPYVLEANMNGRGGGVVL